MQSLTIESPAKLNLFLRVIKKRKDGFHELYTLFHRISLRDAVHLKKKAKGIEIFCSHPQVPKRNNLIVRAFNLLKSKHPFQGGVDVRLIKRIPVGGGLGGGSSNAAIFLLGMNRLFRLGLRRSELAEIGKELGSDVPFFLYETRHAIGTGRGESIHPIPFRKKLWFILIPSPRGLSTGKVYGNLKLPKQAVSLTSIKRGANMATAFLKRGRPELAGQFLVNDLTKSALKIRPALGEMLKVMNRLHLGIFQMSGSGPTLFSVFNSKLPALRASKKLRRVKFANTAILCHSY